MVLFLLVEYCDEVFDQNTLLTIEIKFKQKYKKLILKNSKNDKADISFLYNHFYFAKIEWFENSMHKLSY